MISKLLIKNSLLLSIAPFLPKVISIILLPIMTKYLTDVDFGISATISAYSQSIGAFSMLGMTIVLQNSFYKEPNLYLLFWRQVYGFLKLWMIVFAVLQSLLLYFIIPDEASDNKWIIIFLTVFSNVLFGPTGTIGNSYYIYSKQAYPIVWRSILASLITILTSFILIVYLRLGYMGWYISAFVGTFFSNTTYWYVVNVKLKIRPIYRFSLKEIKDALAVSTPTIPHYYSIYLLESSGRMVMDQNNISQGEIGKISITQQFGDMFQSGMTGLNNAISPYIMQSLKNDEQNTIWKLGLVFVTLIFCLAFLLALWSKEIFCLLLSNDTLKSSYPYFITYIMALCYRPMYLIVSNYYFFYERTQQLLLISFSSGILAFIIYFIFTPKFGIWAFLIGYYIANLYFGYSGYLFSAYKKNTTIKFPVLFIIFMQLFLTACAYILVNLLIIKIIVTAILISILIYIIIKNLNDFKV
jgi:O-antigen/teichoic acid export membrane protein